MKNQHIATPQQLDAALAAQREDKIATLQRQSRAISYQFWIGLAVLGIVIGLVLTTYHVDRRPSQIPYLVGLFGAGGAILGADAARRRRARRELELMLRSQSQQPPNKALDRSRVE